MRTVLLLLLFVTGVRAAAAGQTAAAAQTPEGCSLRPVSVARDLPPDPARRWHLPVQDALARVTARFGWQGPNSAYVAALHHTGGMSETAKGIFHPGIDISARPGEVVRAVAPGEVVATSYSPVYGCHVAQRVATGDARSRHEIIFLYGHLSRISVSVSQTLDPGDVIGLAGMSGERVSGAHLHFEARVDNVAVNPLPLLEMIEAAARDGE